MRVLPTNASEWDVLFKACGVGGHLAKRALLAVRQLVPAVLSPWLHSYCHRERALKDLPSLLPYKGHHFV